MTRKSSCHGLDMLAEVPDPRNNKGKRHPLVSILAQGYLVLGFLSILDEKSRFGDRSYRGKS